MVVVVHISHILVVETHCFGGQALQQRILEVIILLVEVEAEWLVLVLGMVIVGLVHDVGVELLLEFGRAHRRVDFLDLLLVVGVN